MDRDQLLPEGRVDRWIMPFFHEPTLWPVLLVVIGHAMAGLAPLMLAAVRDGSAWAEGLVFAFAALSLGVAVYEVRRRGRPGALSACMAVTWVLSVALAWVANRQGYL